MQTEIVQLRKENQELRQQVNELQSYLKDQGGFPPKWRLTPAEATVLSLLVKRGRVHRDTFEAALRLHARNKGGFVGDTLRQHVLRIRRKISHLGVEIESLYDFGYSMDNEHREIVRKAAVDARDRII